MSQPKQVREKLAEQFQLVKSGPVEVDGGTIVSDGYTVHDLVGITIAKMQEFTGLTTTDETSLWTECCFLASGEIRKEEIEAEYVAVTPEPIIEIPQLPEEGRSMDYEQIFPENKLVIESEGKVVFDETIKEQKPKPYKMSRAEVLEKARAARKVNLAIKAANAEVNKK